MTCCRRRYIRPHGVAWMALLIALSSTATEAARDYPYNGPDARSRPYGENYKDRLLAICLTRAYKAAPEAARDASGTASLLLDWTDYDLEAATLPMFALVDRYLASGQPDLVAKTNPAGRRPDLLKCLAMYHSPELQAQVKRFVDHPQRSYSQDHAPTGDTP
ncbi:type VI secretion system amidase immunity protein Tai4 [Frateuria aurantia]|uniref:Uncharacterized protein n=1 Tax=Frateuria aurantia (strain ATCC 33424 / DSM 6220 / KCTC 2777 / LMG 1558 / NBRC 3245 / NCIMB 13370) TaxID=767434 RepID=H8L5F9_FRAAD|nr:type VI secretion system amidase immunity protein Tai4 [Frateuria aurantia]AFC85760.1 hypothetical protein Fraau_1322 [Frateuria aurantia DSM 6220]